MNKIAITNLKQDYTKKPEFEAMPKTQSFKQKLDTFEGKTNKNKEKETQELTFKQKVANFFRKSKKFIAIGLASLVSIATVLAVKNKKAQEINNKENNSVQENSVEEQKINTSPKTNIKVEQNEEPIEQINNNTVQDVDVEQENEPIEQLSNPIQDVKESKDTEEPQTVATVQEIEEVENIEESQTIKEIQALEESDESEIQSPDFENDYFSIKFLDKDAKAKVCVDGKEIEMQSNSSEVLPINLNIKQKALDENIISLKDETLKVKEVVRIVREVVKQIETKEECSQLINLMQPLWEVKKDTYTNGFRLDRAIMNGILMGAKDKFKNLKLEFPKEYIAFSDIPTNQETEKIEDIIEENYRLAGYKVCSHIFAELGMPGISKPEEIENNCNVSEDKSPGFENDYFSIKFLDKDKKAEVSINGKPIKISNISSDVPPISLNIKQKALDEGFATEQEVLDTYQVNKIVREIVKKIETKEECAQLINSIQDLWEEQKGSMGNRTYRLDRAIMNGILIGATDKFKNLKLEFPKEYIATSNIPTNQETKEYVDTLDENYRLAGYKVCSHIFAKLGMPEIGKPKEI